MQEYFLRYKLIHLVDLALFVFCLAGLYHISKKATLPLRFSGESNLLITGVLSKESLIKLNDELVTVDNFHFDSREEIELYTDGKGIDEQVQLGIQLNVEYFTKTVKLIPCYSFFLFANGIPNRVCILFYSSSSFYKSSR